MLETTDAGQAIDALIERLGGDLRVGVPLGAGKPPHLLNALYGRAKADPSIRLTIYTALTLSRPRPQQELERRFLEPVVDRIFADYPELLYEQDRLAGALPDNVRIVEFYFPPGKYLDNPVAQQDYISSNYTHVARDLLKRGVNVLMSLVCEGDVDGRRQFSLSCNPDVAVDMMRALRMRRETGADAMFLAEVNQNLPFMFGEAVLEPEAFDVVLNDRRLDVQIIGPPKESVSEVDHLIGLHVSALVRDGGELQVGIGALGDAICSALLLRHQHNDTYRELLQRAGIAERYKELIRDEGGTGPFEQGLFSASEMMIDGFLDLFEAGVIRRKVWDDATLQRLVNAGELREEVDGDGFRALIRTRRLGRHIDPDELAWLQHWGVFRQGVRLDGETIIAPDGARIANDLDAPGVVDELITHCLGERLRHGAMMHAAFFLGPLRFYQRLKALPEAQRRLILMRSVLRINQLYGHEEVDRLHRRDGRFINTAMMMTLFGAAVSDGLADGRVVSGVGGQYNFVAMAHELPGGRSILLLRSTRKQHGRTTSSIVYNYGHVTIPRHLRDIVITEYGIADLRGKTDREVAEAMLSITDSRFQDELVRQAQAAGKLPADYRIPDAWRSNTPERVHDLVRTARREFGVMPPFPLGSDLTPVEIELGRALLRLKATLEKGAPAVAALLLASGDHARWAEHLDRMGLREVKGLKQRLYRRLLLAALEQSSAAAS